LTRGAGGRLAYPLYLTLSEKTLCVPHGLICSGGILGPARAWATFL
jgi:hypothetical protein